MAARSRGFTLIELMVAVAIITVLGAIAYPSYASHVAKSRRSDATAGLLGAAQAMERYFSEHATFVGATLGTTGVYANSSSHGYYTLAIASQTATAFSLTAAPGGVQASDACGTFSYNQTGTKGVSGGTLTAADCW